MTMPEYFVHLSAPRHVGTMRDGRRAACGKLIYTRRRGDTCTWDLTRVTCQRCINVARADTLRNVLVDLLKTAGTPAVAAVYVPRWALDFVAGGPQPARDEADPKTIFGRTLVVLEDGDDAFIRYDGGKECRVTLVDPRSDAERAQAPTSL